ncbi:MAG TPA: peptidoglycan-binding protein [Chthoniobacterales bacterium]
MKTRWVGLAIALVFAAIGTSYAGNRHRNHYYRGDDCNYSRGYYNHGPVYPRPFFRPPVVVFTTWAPRPVYTRTVVYQTVNPESRYGDSRLARAQARLARLGYYSGYIDGDYGPQTARAIRLYQAENGLPITGRLDKWTRRSLGI